MCCLVLCKVQRLLMAEARLAPSPSRTPPRAALPGGTRRVSCGALPAAMRVPGARRVRARPLSVVPAVCQVNETWTLENCTVAKCEGDNHIALLPPTPVSKVTCVNGREPIKVQSPQDPCESHYECECEWPRDGHVM